MRRFLLVPLLLAGCQPAPAPVANDTAAAANVALPEPAAPLPPVEPIPPGQPGGLPDDRTPISEAPFTPESAQGAADVVQRYYALIASGRYADAFALRVPGQQDAGAFAAGFARYAEYHAQVGGPGKIDAGAGQRLVTVPVQTYGREKNGAPFHASGTSTLQRTEVDGATPDQRRWRIREIALKTIPE